MIESRMRLDSAAASVGCCICGHDDGELVAAQPRHGVRLARAAAQALADQLEQLVADRMAERVVDALELVEVEAEHRQALAALDALELVLEMLAHHGAVGQVGERVVARHVRDALFRALPFGDVLVGRQPAAAGDRLVDHREGAAVGERDGLLHGFAGGERFGQPGDVFDRVAGEAAAGDAMLDQLAQRAARLGDVGR